MKTIWLEQKVYQLSTVDGTRLKLDSKPEIFLVLNGVNTGVPIENLFTNQKATFDNEDNTYKGYSILSLIGHTPEALVIGGDESDIKVTFIESKTQKSLVVSKIKNPFFQFNDEQITGEQLESAINDIKNLLQPARVEPPAAEDGLTLVGEPTSVVEENIEQVEHEQKEEDIINGEYEKDKLSFLSEGYKEYSFKNFRFLKNGTKKPILIELEKEDYKSIPVDKTDYENVFSFKSGEESRLVKLIDETLVIE